MNDNKEEEKEQQHNDAQDTDIPSPGELPPADFTFMVKTFATQVLVHLGMMPNPFGDNLKPDLKLARFNIDLLEMLETKTQGNLTEDESRLLTEFLHHARMNYVEALKAEEK